MFKAMMFITLLAAYSVLRFANPGWQGPYHLPILMTSINTLILLSSSFFLHQAQTMINKGTNQKLFSKIGITLVLGIIFLVLQGVEWAKLIREGLVLKTGPFASTFFTLTGFHGLHVLVGLCVLLFLLMRSKQQPLKNPTPFHIGSMYWHFVDAVWIVIFVSLYLT
ncbi:MAG: heme-copper oxidase subunit III [Chlamydiae bacterium]|nr:heme-copper oxidase subunit III [Chlamydiota bacterium]